MKFSLTGQEKGDILIQVTTWAVVPMAIFLKDKDFDKTL